MQRCEPHIAEPHDPEAWLDRSGSPKPELDDAEEQGQTVDQDTLL
jgi:hypothetical protein